MIHSFRDVSAEVCEDGLTHQQIAECRRIAGCVNEYRTWPELRSWRFVPATSNGAALSAGTNAETFMHPALMQEVERNLRWDVLIDTRFANTFTKCPLVFRQIPQDTTQAEFRESFSRLDSTVETPFRLLLEGRARALDYRGTSFMLQMNEAEPYHYGLAQMKMRSARQDGLGPWPALDEQLAGGMQPEMIAASISEHPEDVSYEMIRAVLQIGNRTLDRLTIPRIEKALEPKSYWQPEDNDLVTQAYRSALDTLTHRLQIAAIAPNLGPVFAAP